ncbi:MAG: transporter substrate-binding domain-containing protein [Pseudomonadota bacterium]
MLLAEGLMCGAGSQQLGPEPSAPVHPPGTGSRTLVLNSADGPPFSRADGTGIIDLVLKEIFRRVGIEIRILAVPAERALRNASEGDEDGIFSRIAGMSEKYPGLVQVPEKLVDFEFVAFSKKIDVEMKGWESLQPYEVAIITGWKILEENIRNTVSLHKVRDVNTLFNLLASDRVEMVVYSRLGGEATIRDLGLKGVKTLEPPLASREMFLYLNRKHAGLVATVSESLRKMKEDGAYQRIMGHLNRHN